MTLRKLRWLLLPLIFATAGAGYGTWVLQRTEGIYAGLSIERLRYAHLNDQQRLELSCLGAHARIDAARGHAIPACRSILKQAGLLP